MNFKHCFFCLIIALLTASCSGCSSESNSESTEECSFKYVKTVDQLVYQYNGFYYYTYLFYFGDNTGYASVFVSNMGQVIFHTELCFKVSIRIEGNGGYLVASNDANAMGHYLPVLYYTEDFEYGPWSCVVNNMAIPMSVYHPAVNDALSQCRLSNKIYYCE